MKFGAVFDDFRSVDRFKRMIIVAEKQAQQLVIIRFTADTVYVISSEGNECKVQCEVPSNSLFIHYIFEGISRECNEAFIQINGDYLARILRNANNPTLKKMRLKLVKKNESYISTEVEFIENNSDVVREVCHNIPIIVVSRKFWPEFVNFTTPESHVSVFLPSVHMVRNVIDRLKQWDCYVLLIVKNNGATSMKVTGSSKMATNFRTCKLNKDVVPSREESIVRLDVKRISLYFNNLHVDSHTQCFVTHERCVHFKSMFGETCFQLILPHCCE